MEGIDVEAEPILRRLLDDQTVLISDALSPIEQIKIARWAAKTSYAVLAMDTDLYPSTMRMLRRFKQAGPTPYFVFAATIKQQFLPVVTNLSIGSVHVTEPLKALSHWKVVIMIERLAFTTVISGDDLHKVCTIAPFQAPIWPLNRLHAVNDRLEVSSTVKAGEVLGGIMNSVRLDSQPLRRLRS
jgi:hypothetical protein